MSEDEYAFRITQCLDDGNYPHKAAQRTSYISIFDIIRKLRLFFLIGFLVTIGVLYRPLVIFIIILAVSGLINYIIHVSGIHLHLGHVSFLNVLFSYKLGFWYGISIIIGAHVIPEILAGHVDPEMMVSAVIYALIAFIASTFVISVSHFVIFGMILLVLQTTLSFIIGFAIGTPFTELLTEHGVEHVLVMIWYFQFSGIIMFLLG